MPCGKCSHENSLASAERIIVRFPNGKIYDSIIISLFQIASRPKTGLKQSPIERKRNRWARWIVAAGVNALSAG